MIRLIIVKVLLLISLQFNAQTRDTIYNNDKFYDIKVKHFIFPAAVITYGVISLENHHLKRMNFYTKNLLSSNPLNRLPIDDYMQFVPAASVFVMNAFGLKGKHNWKDAALIYAGSIIITTGFVSSIKYITKVERPDGSAKNSFPSGHTATAFASAEFLRREYRDVSQWIGVAGYTFAIGTGLLRIYNNKHWFSDVIAGAGFGILSTTLSYIIYDKVLKRYNLTFSFVPTYYNNSIGLTFYKQL